VSLEVTVDAELMLQETVKQGIVGYVVIWSVLD